MTARLFIMVGAFLTMIGGSQAFGQCAALSRMSLSQINANVIGKFTCVGVSPNAQWNESLAGGTVTDFKLGPASPKDPTAVVGGYTVTGVDDNRSGGILTYNYTGGGSFPYWIDTGTGTGTLGTSPFTFCPTGGGTPIVVNVQATHC